jgi:TonB family protein
MTILPTIQRSLLVYAASLALACGASGRSRELAAGGPHVMPTARLCEVLETIAPGDRRTITVSGIFIVGYEHQLFYDPDQPACTADVQPTTWVDLAAGVKSGELDRLLRRSGRARVTFTGVLYGPGALGLDDPKLPPFLAFLNRTANRRYGHLNGYRTKLVVSAIHDVHAVPESLRSEERSDRASSPTPSVERADVPRYPSLARNAGIAGVVTVEFTVTAGEVTSAEAKSGDRMLSSEAVANVRTWRFATATNGTLTTTFTYELEQRQSGSSELPRITLELPARVHVVAAANGW